MTILNLKSLQASVCLFLGLFWNIQAFSNQHLSIQQSSSLVASTRLAAANNNKNNKNNLDHDNNGDKTDVSTRRTNLQQLATGMMATLATALPANAAGEDTKSREDQRDYIQGSYADFTKAKEGWSYREVKPGTGDKASEGDRVVFDWSGYTIGYFGRPFQAKGGPQGGAFDKDLDYERTVIGSGKMIKGLEFALKDMQAGAVRQVVIPYGDLSYPEGDGKHDRVGPKPATFSGDRALNFVLDNQRLDRTLLFNVKVIRVDKANGKGGYARGS